MISTGDALSDFDKDDDEKYRMERRLPRCCKCDQPIWDEYLWDFMDALYCDKCAEKTYRKSAEDYVRN